MDCSRIKSEAGKTEAGIIKDLLHKVSFSFLKKGGLLIKDNGLNLSSYFYASLKPHHHDSKGFLKA